MSLDMDGFNHSIIVVSTIPSKVSVELAAVHPIDWFNFITFSTDLIYWLVSYSYANENDYRQTNGKCCCFLIWFKVYFEIYIFKLFHLDNILFYTKEKTR